MIIVAISYYKKYQDQMIDPAGVKDILGWETCTIACSGEQVNETAEALQNRNDCKVSWIIDNCCFVVDNALRQYFFYSKDTVVNDVIFVKADMDEKRGRIKIQLQAVKEAV